MGVIGDIQYVNPLTTATLSGPASITVGVAATYTVTLNVPANQTYVITPSCPGATVSPGTFNITAGNASGTFTVTAASAGSYSVDFDTSPVLTRVGRPLAVTAVAAAGAPTWLFVDSSTISTASSSTFPLATDIPTGAIAQASPDLLPGQSLSIAANVLSLLSDSTLPTVNGSLGAVINAVSDRNIYIEVMDSPIATIYNRTQGTRFGVISDGTTFYQCMQAANHNDLIEITPGALFRNTGDCAGYYTGLKDCSMAIFKGVTVRGIPGRGRWRLFPPSYAASNIGEGTSACFILGPTEAAPEFGGLGGGKNIVLSDFDFVDQLGYDRTGGGGRSAVGVQMSGPSAYNVSSWDYYHISVTLQNFKIGRTAFLGGHGLSGPARTLNVIDGHVFDMGFSGYEHNMYISAETLNMRGVRSQRTRGYVPPTSLTMDGHLLKTDAQRAFVEGCSFEQDPVNGDAAKLVQFYGGGVIVVRGCLFVDSVNTAAASQGMIVMERELQDNVNGTPPNYGWFAGLSGNALLVEKNVFVGHYPRPAVFFFPQNHTHAIFTAGTSGKTTAQCLQNLTVRDNIGMIASSTTNWNSIYELAGFASQAADKPLWIYQDPNAGPSWGTRGNTIVNYIAPYDESPFNNRSLKIYNRATGPIAAGVDAVPTYAFTWPHGSMARDDAYKGLDSLASVGYGYATLFEGTENPISEGNWIDGSVFQTGTSDRKTSVQTIGGAAYGTMTTYSTGHYTDSCACLSGFGPNHEVIVTIQNNGAGSGNVEVEILLRADITSGHVFLYEIDCVNSGKHIVLVRWDMTTANPNLFTNPPLRSGPGGEVPFNNGDQIYASIVGTVITCRYKPFGGSFSTLFTYDTAGDPIKYSTGNPGIGFWNMDGSGSTTLFGFSSFVARTLP